MKTSEYYKKNPEARAKRLKQQAKYNKTKKGLNLRTAANKLNRKLGTYGNGDGKDASHTSKTKGKLEIPSKNRARKGRYASWRQCSLHPIITCTTYKLWQVQKQSVYGAKQSNRNSTVPVSTAELIMNNLNSLWITSNHEQWEDKTYRVTLSQLVEGVIRIREQRTG